MENNRKLIGYLVKPDKAAKHLSEDFRREAARAGLNVVVIDPARPVAEQGDFAAIVHKSVGNLEQEALIEDFQSTHPDVPIVDPTERVRLLHDRSTMLSVLNGGIRIQDPTDETGQRAVLCSAPAQAMLPAGISCADAISAIEDAGLQLPLLAKPLLTGRSGSHDLSLIRDLTGLQSLIFETKDSKLQLPVVVQQYIEHGGELAKVYCMGANVVMVKRRSLTASAVRGSGIVTLSRVSAYPAAAIGNELLRSSSDAAVPDPPEWLVRSLTQTLQHRLGLQLFNFDLLVPSTGSAQQPQCFVIDINFFPGFEKLPGYEEQMVRFLRAVVDNEKTGDGYGPASFSSISQLSQ